MNSHIVTVGSLNADFVISVNRFPAAGETLVGKDFRVFPGGKGANQAYAAAKLGGQVSMVGQVGNDAYADWLRQNLATVGTHVEWVQSDPAVSSGIATITIDEHGQNQIIIIPGANGTLTREKLSRAASAIRSAGLVLLQLEIPIETVQAAARTAKEAGARVILDPAPARPLPDALLQDVDYLTPNETELALLTGTSVRPLTRTHAAELGRQLRDRGAAKVIVKMGAQGALLLSEQGEHFWPAIAVKAIDTTAAGDAFNAAFAFGLARGQSELVAGEFAVAAAAVSVTRAGAQPSMPALSEVESLLRKRV